MDVRLPKTFTTMLCAILRSHEKRPKHACPKELSLGPVYEVSHSVSGLYMASRTQLQYTLLYVFSLAIPDSNERESHLQGTLQACESMPPEWSLEKAKSSLHSWSRTECTLYIKAGPKGTPLL